MRPLEIPSRLRPTRAGDAYPVRLTARQMSALSSAASHVMATLASEVDLVALANGKHELDAMLTAIERYGEYL